ncbi:hypothetical protein E2C01_098191 [Portunus trituberculatus]|uniref:Uncharacterized protein n=1 Tax=Portunus trituberculatus TaxID=210409 RepID=A0A5B7KBH2_PORTR|nr:hypothetical protein [Portunus trituberculatus]
MSTRDPTRPYPLLALPAITPAPKTHLTLPLPRPPPVPPHHHSPAQATNGPIHSPFTPPADPVNIIPASRVGRFGEDSLGSRRLSRY